MLNFLSVKTISGFFLKNKQRVLVIRYNINIKYITQNRLTMNKKKNNHGKNRGFFQ